MTVKELRDILSNYRDIDEVSLVSSEGIDNNILTIPVGDYFRTDVIPAGLENECFTIALAITHPPQTVATDYIISDVICSQNSL